MEDCVHLKACRRLQKIFKGAFYGAHVARNCNEDCSAYQDYETVIEEEKPAWWDWYNSCRNDLS